MPDFRTRLHAVFADRGHLCLGIDPHATLLAEWGLPDSGDGVREFGLRAVDAAAGTIGIIKPQIAFFERHGAAGYAALEQVIAAARDAGMLVIADVKRGDIGSTVDAYGEAWLRPGSPLEADAMTAVAYQGVGSLAGVIERALEADKGVFVLAATSNPEAAAVQTARVSRGAADGRTVAASIVHEVAELGGSIGVVIGATVRLDDYGLAPAELAAVPVLAPGFGDQGARLGDARALYGDAVGSVVANVSRQVLRAGPDGLGEALLAARDELAEAVAR